MNLERIINELKDISCEARASIQNRINQEIDNAYIDGRDMCMIKMMDLLIDSSLCEAEIVSLLQKHFDLRLSEVQDMMKTAKNRKRRILEKK